MGNFKVGDYVKKRCGKTIAVVESSYGDYYSYVTVRTVDKNRRYHWYISDLVLVENYIPEGEMVKSQKTLYSFVDDSGKTQYGSHVGTDSSNRLLIEVKGSGEIVVKSIKELEEVLPYTFSAIINGKETHFQTEPGALNKGDVLLYTGTQVPVVVSVKDIDTKSREARSKFNGVKLVTEKI